VPLFQMEGLLTGYLLDATCWRIKSAAADISRLIHAILARSSKYVFV